MVKLLHLRLVEVEVGDERVDLDPWEAAPGEVPLVGVPLQFLHGDQHLDVVTVQQFVDLPGDGELEAAEADHHQVDDEAGQGHGQQLTEDGEVVVPGPSRQDQTSEVDRADLLLGLSLHDPEPGHLVPDVAQDVGDVLLLSCRTFEGTCHPHPEINSSCIESLQ